MARASECLMELEELLLQVLARQSALAQGPVTGRDVALLEDARKLLKEDVYYVQRQERDLEALNADLESLQQLPVELSWRKKEEGDIAREKQKNGEEMVQLNRFLASVLSPCLEKLKTIGIEMHELIAFAESNLSMARSLLESDQEESDSDDLDDVLACSGYCRGKQKEFCNKLVEAGQSMVTTSFSGFPETRSKLNDVLGNLKKVQNEILEEDGLENGNVNQESEKSASCTSSSPFQSENNGGGGGDDVGESIAHGVRKEQEENGSLNVIDVDNGDDDINILDLVKEYKKKKKRKKKEKEKDQKSKSKEKMKKARLENNEDSDIEKEKRKSKHKKRKKEGNGDGDEWCSPEDDDDGDNIVWEKDMKKFHESLVKTRTNSSESSQHNRKAAIEEAEKNDETISSNKQRKYQKKLDMYDPEYSGSFPDDPNKKSHPEEMLGKFIEIIWSDNQVQNFYVSGFNPNAPWYQELRDRHRKSWKVRLNEIGAVFTCPDSEKRVRGRITPDSNYSEISFVPFEPYEEGESKEDEKKRKRSKSEDDEKEAAIANDIPKKKKQKRQREEDKHVLRSNAADALANIS